MASDRAVPALYFPQPQTLVSAADVPHRAHAGGDPSAVRGIDTWRLSRDRRGTAAGEAYGHSTVVASAAIATRRLTLWLVAIFGFTAVVLAVVGVYGVIAQAVAQRTHEFGIRQALGATRGDILRLVMVSGAAMTIAGLLGGIALAIVSTRLLTALLYGVTPLDLPTFAAVAVILLDSRRSVPLTCRRDARQRISAAAALRD